VTQVQHRMFEALQRAEQQARRRVECLREVVFEIDAEGRLTFLNGAWSDLLGHRVEDSLGRRLVDFCHPEDGDGVHADTCSARPLRFFRSDGGLRWLQVTFGVSDGGDVLTGSLADVTARREAEIEAERERLFLSTVLENLNEEVYACDAEGRLVLTRGGRCDPVPTHEWLDGYPIFHADGHTSFTLEQLPLHRALQGEQVDGVEMIAVAQDARPRRLLVRARRMTDASGNVIGALAVARDVTAEHETATRLAHVARHDGLTGTATREAFLDELGPMVSGGSAGTVLVADLDDFGSLNDRLGQERGDRILREVAHRLQQLVPVRGRVARVAADAFAVLVEEAEDAAAASAWAARIAAALAVPLESDSEQVKVTASIGAAVLDESMATAGQTLAAAEAAQQRASRHGLGSFLVFSPQMRTEIRLRVEYEAALQRALDENQFRLFYQPKVSLEDHRVIGVEALLRWQHPERGLVPPAEFVSVAEQTGLIVPIGAWVRDEALRQAAQWRAVFPEQPPLEMCVNVSARQFDQTLADTVGAALQAHSIDPATIWLEVTESMVMVDVAAAVEVLRSLKELGVNVTVDDFGTGYSSLAYLRRLPLDGLKIDRSFVDGLGRESEDTAIVAAILGMAHALELHVVAEGIETSEQLSALRNLGCECGQGYHYSRPQPAEFVTGLLAAASASGSPHPTISRSSATDVPDTDVVLVVDDTADVRQLARMSLTTGGSRCTRPAGGSRRCRWHGGSAPTASCSTCTCPTSPASRSAARCGTTRSRPAARSSC
jgi:diguanylate cyclase (GGDEF)-like protein/PAS domain S-box-containing protein